MAIIMQKAHIQQRLGQIFANVKDEKKRSIYTDEKNVLHFYFDNGIDPDPAFCGMISGNLKLIDDNLFLTFEEKNRKRSELVCCGIKVLGYEFLTHDGFIVKTTNAWSKAETKNPLFFKLLLNDESYVFWINHQGMEIPLQ